MAGPAQAVPAILGQASEDAEMVVTIPNLKQASDNLAAWKQASQIPGRQFDNPLGTAQGMLGVRQGLNAQGGMVVSITGVAETMENPEQSNPVGTAVVPVTSYEQFAGNFDANAQGMSEIRMPNGDTGYIKPLGEDYALMSRKKAGLEGYTPAGSAEAVVGNVGSLGSAYLNDSDISLWVNTQALAPAFKAELEKQFANERSRIKQEVESGDGTQARLAGFDKMSDAIMTLVDETRNGVLGLDVNGQGLGLSLSMQQREGGALSDYVKDSTGAAMGLLKRLPKQDFLLAAAFDGQAIAMDRLTEQAQQLIDQFLPQDAGGQAKTWRTYVSKAMSLVGQTRGTAQAMYVPGQQQMMSGGALQQVTISEVADPDQYVADFKGMLEQVPALAQMPGQAGGQGPPGQQQGVTVNYQENATSVSVDGQDFQADRFQMNMNLPQEAMQQMGPMAMMMGGGNQQGFVAKRDNYVVATTGSDKALLTKGLTSAGSDQGLATSEAFNKIAERALPPNPIAAMYISFSGIGQMANQFAPMMGMGGGRGSGGPGGGQQGQNQWLNIPADLSPAAIGVGAKDSGVAMRLYLPGETVQFISQTVQRKIMPMMMGGMGGRRGGMGGPGGGPGGPGGPGAPPAPPNQ
jgi:hypothetical protein